MGKGYSSEEIREKLIVVLEHSTTGMSGVEISEKDILTAVEDAGFDLDGVKWLTGKNAK